MKIIKEGEPKRLMPWLGEWKCWQCKAEWTLEEGDPQPRKVEGDPNDQRERPYYTMPCPCCGRNADRAA